MQTEREGSVAGVGTMNIWSTSSCNFLVPSGPVWVQSYMCVYVYIYHFHLIMDIAVHIQLYETQLMMGSSHHIISSQLMSPL